MKRYRVLTALTFLALPCWLGTSAIPLLAYADSFLACKGLLDVFRVFGKCPALMAGAIPIAAVVWRIIEILRGNGWRVVAVSGWWRIVPTVLSCAFWGFFVMVAVVEGNRWLNVWVCMVLIRTNVPFSFMAGKRNSAKLWRKI